MKHLDVETLEAAFKLHNGDFKGLRENLRRSICLIQQIQSDMVKKEQEATSNKPETRDENLAQPVTPKPIPDELMDDMKELGRRLLGVVQMAEARVGSMSCEHFDFYIFSTIELYEFNLYVNVYRFRY